MGTELTVRRTLDLTRAPDERWNEEMVSVVAKNVFRGAEITKSQLYYCLSVAESLGLNPLIGEIYYLQGKSTDASGPAWTPYIGRNGLVAKAAERGYYFESDTVHANDRFRILRKAGGERTCTHSYGQEERGAIVGAYAFLHARAEGEMPAFFYAKLSEYLPTFDQEWKMRKSPWGNQRSAMIEKTAMIGAGRKRLNLGNVLIDGEIARLEQQRAETGPPGIEMRVSEFDWSSLERTAGAEATGRLREAVEGMREVDENAWPPARLEMLALGLDAVGVDALTERVVREREALVERTEAVEAREPVRATNHSQAEVDRVSEALAASEVADAEVVPEWTAEDEQRAEMLRARIAGLQQRLGGASGDEAAALEDELAHVGRELGALSTREQGRLL